MLANRWVLARHLKRMHRPVKPLEAGFAMEGDVRTMQEQLSDADEGYIYSVFVRAMYSFQVSQ